MTSLPLRRIAVDIGGTFTDTVLVANDEILATAKTLTTPHNPAEGALAGVRKVMEGAGLKLGDISAFIHGTTLATNALIERRGARTASITTAGFRDILEIAYERRYSQYDIDLEKPDLIVPRSRALTVPERIMADGHILQPLDESAIDGLVEELDACGAETIAICLLHAYANPVHEQRLAALLKERRPNLALSLSSEVSPEAREFERLCTTIANAYVQPLMSSYLAKLSEDLAVEGLACRILMMTSGGGMTTLETAARFPIRLVESGPAGGAALAAEVAARCNKDQVLSFDMGGTTAKLCLIDNQRPQTSRHFEISRAARFIKGSGMPVRIPVVEMIEIGAGGGSIAGVDDLGRLSVGPQSAGSEPGPAAFGKGGSQPTVTDADIALGLIEPTTFAEGRLQVDPAAADLALQEEIGIPLGLDARGAARGVSEIVDESMASAARIHAVESGKDLSLRTMIAFGGNGPLHATRMARRAGVSRILIPRDPGVGSAVGFLHAPVSFEIVRSSYATLEQLDVGAINSLFESMIAEAEEVVRAGAPGEALQRKRAAFMRYRGQGHEIEIVLPDHALGREELAKMRKAFEQAYETQFARIVPGMIIEILNWAVSVSSLRKPAAALPRPAIARRLQPKAVRSITSDLSGAVISAGLYRRENLAPGDWLAGPALVQEPQTTTLVSEDFSALVDSDGNLHLERLETQEQRS
jgi:N-methylhydantoinase A